MIFKRYGDKNLPALMLIQGSCTTAGACYGPFIKRLTKEYHCILCKLDGHYEGSHDFPGVKAEAQKIEKYILDQYDGKIYAIAALSLGATITVELLSGGKVEVDKVLLDGVYTENKGSFYAAYATMMTYFGSKRMKKGKSVPKSVIAKIFGEGNESIIDYAYNDLSFKTCKHIMLDVYRYKINEKLDECTSKVLCIRGDDEPIPEISYKLLKSHLPHAEEKVFPECGHAQYLFDHRTEYLGTLLEFLKSE